MASPCRADCNTSAPAGTEKSRYADDLRLFAAGDELFAYAVAQAGGAGGDVAAIDRDLRAADKTRLLRCQEQHEIGAFFWRSLAVHWGRHPHGVGKGLAAASEETSIGDLSGMYRIDPDVPLRELQHCGLGQTAQCPFAGSVGCVVMRGQPGGRRDIDD